MVLSLILHRYWLILLLILALQSSLTFPSTASTMKVHPVVPRKRNITIQFGVDAAAAAGKKLRRLPHVFSRVLELPFRSDADVAIEEAPDYFRFVAETDGIGDVRAHAVEIHPGVTKIVVRDGSPVEFSIDDLQLDMWRFRLPESTRPELASAVFVDGELIVTVPKGEDEEEEPRENVEDGDGGRGMGGGGRLVLVQ
ncbi:hypothetical protein PIB30_018285 [Stylosanthes scabra]|uniref:SHSP domain-containing protein n=1 Tax=Stylosanthes scabra TaxID=79078 RepID=A0ABU6Y9Q0_9FABA|nr:hypothetical protein [Stylosanthes scabra]